ncbi:hypothetical protein TIFTF001_019106 [Ficus carica]|uniref:Uncharacterized protein n=1 Tax=Ficus carica TaxID=3494 RepID=A0AA88DBF7_FICCA|nr:hypothetical protein TIFTF001_019106 [Ficus carica]
MLVLFAVIRFYAYFDALPDVVRLVAAGVVRRPRYHRERESRREHQATRKVYWRACRGRKRS